MEIFVAYGNTLLCQRMTIYLDYPFLFFIQAFML